MAKNYHLKLKGFVGGCDFDKDYVDYKLESHSDEDVDVLIDSLGGEVSTGLSISSAFRDHGRVSVHFRGMNASAATVASLGAKHITMDSSAMYLAHKCSLPVLEWNVMNADELRAKAEELLAQAESLDKIDLNIASLYANRCKKKPQDLLSLMKVGGWLSAEEALEWGFVDEIVKDDGSQKPTLNKKTIAALNAAGIPLPNIPLDDEEGFFQRLKNFFYSSPSVTSVPEQKESNTKTIHIMNFKFIGQITHKEEFDVSNDAVTLSVAETQLVENAFAERDKQLDEANKKIEELTNTVNELKKVPAAPVKAVDPSTSKQEKSGIGSYVDTVNSAQNLYDLLD